MIGQVDLRAPRVNLVSIPRDLLVDIPGYGKDRINTAYVYGEQFKEPGGGIGLLQRTIEKNFGVQVDHFGLVDFQCFRTAVDAVGGVTVNVPRAIVDTQYPTEDYGTKVVKFETGHPADGRRARPGVRPHPLCGQRLSPDPAPADHHRRHARAGPAASDAAVPADACSSGCRNMRSDLGWREYLNLATIAPVARQRAGSRSPPSTRSMVVDTTLSSGAAVLLPRWDADPRADRRERSGPARASTRANPAAAGSPPRHRRRRRRRRRRSRWLTLAGPVRIAVAGLADPARSPRWPVPPPFDDAAGRRHPPARVIRPAQARPDLIRAS